MKMLGLFKKVILMGIVFMLVLFPGVLAVTQAEPSQPVYYPTPQPTPDVKELIVELELRPDPAQQQTAFYPHGLGGFQVGGAFWVDVYLVPPFSYNLLETRIELSSPADKAVIVSATDPKFKGVSGVLPDLISFTTTETADYPAVTKIALHYKPTSGTLRSMAKSRIHFGSFKAWSALEDSKVLNNLVFTLEPDSTKSYSWYSYESGGGTTLSMYSGATLKLGGIKAVSPTACSYKAANLCKGKCGVVDNGCGGAVDCTAVAGQSSTCAIGQVCVSNACVSAVSLALPATAPSHDKTVLQQVSDAVSNAKLTKLQKLAAIVNAVKAWLAAQ